MILLKKNPGFEIISLGVYLSEDVPEGINPVKNAGALSVPVEADGMLQTQL